MFKIGEYMVNAAIKNLKDGTISDTIAITYVGNYCIKGWIAEEEMQTALVRITAIAAGEPDPAEEVTEDIAVEDVTDYNSMTVAELRTLAKDRGLSGYSSITKDELIALLEADDAGTVV